MGAFPASHFLSKAHLADFVNGMAVIVVQSTIDKSGRLGKAPNNNQINFNITRQSTYLPLGNSRYLYHNTWHADIQAPYSGYSSPRHRRRTLHTPRSPASLSERRVLVGTRSSL